MSLARKMEFLYNAKGKKTAVILPISKYEQLVEDLADLQAVTDRKKEKDIPYSQVKRKLKKRNV